MPHSNYLKYYWLEDYLFSEVRRYFHIKKHLTPLQFFSIVIWKRNASKTIIKRGLLKNGLSLDRTIKILTEKIFRADNQNKLNALLGCKGIGLAIASAILTVLYPKEFTVFDVRVCGQLKYPDIANAKGKVRRYLKEYIPLAKKIGKKVARNSNLSLRDCDRVLWAKSWYEDLIKRFLGSGKITKGSHG